MAGGGQRGLSFVGEPMVFAIIATFLITILLQLQLGCLGDGMGNDSARAQSEEDCEEAWAVEYDGDPDTVNETAILSEQWCIDHLAAVETEVQADQNEIEAEATAP